MNTLTRASINLNRNMLPLTEEARTMATRNQIVTLLDEATRLTARTLIGLVLFFTSMLAVQAQATGCGLTSVHAGKELNYPAIARAAHIEGVVVAIVTFDHDGRPSNARIATGPEMLQRAALDYVKSLQANPYAGYRECPMVEVFRLEGQSLICGTSPNDDMTTAYFPTFKHLDLQHVELAIKLGCITVISDPAAKKIHGFYL